MSALPISKLQALEHIANEISQGILVFPASVNAAIKLQKALDDPNCHIEAAIKLVITEPLLSARTVALANSAAFNRSGGPLITNVRTAVMRMGYKNLRALVAATIVRNFGSKIIDVTVRQKAEQLWEHTANVAAFSQAIARRLTYVNADTALFAAIVHEVGSFYLLSRADEFPSLLSDEGENVRLPIMDLINHEVMGQLSIPEPVCTAIDELPKCVLSEEPTTLTDTLLLARHFVKTVSPFSPAVTDASGVVVPASESIGAYVTDNNELNELLSDAEDDIKSMTSALL